MTFVQDRVNIVTMSKFDNVLKQYLTEDDTNAPIQMNSQDEQQLQQAAKNGPAAPALNKLQTILNGNDPSHQAWAALTDPKNQNQKFSQLDPAHQKAITSVLVSKGFPVATQPQKSTPDQEQSQATPTASPQETPQGNNSGNSVGY